MRPVILRRRRSSSSSASVAKPPSIIRYTLILLKARPSVSDIDTISVYAEKRSAASSSVLARSAPEEPDFLILRRDGPQTPPPPYEP